MKYLLTGKSLTFKVSKGERKNIDLIRKEIFSELDWFITTVREELTTETESFITPSFVIDQLERIKLDLKDNLAFSKSFYEQKCFYINDNGHITITSNEQLFFHYIYAYKMLDDIDEGLRVAKGIIKVCVIDRTIKLISEELNNKEKEAPYPFKSLSYYENFLEYTNNHIPKTIPEYSYLFQKLTAMQIIDRMSHIQFMDWLYAEEIIDEDFYQVIKVNGGFYSLHKSSPSKKEPIFNKIFNLN